ncbi:hypothetical protein APTSU1_000438600 [Apodemus speciosus]|uniref:Uncharacterized protein n=1 Tax=Apodemus speciosus TaxID=105296 RepID=A0ABQ0EQT3_APOSI
MWSPRRTPLPLPAPSDSFPPTPFQHVGTVTELANLDVKSLGNAITEGDHETHGVHM